MASNGYNPNQVNTDPQADNNIMPAQPTSNSEQAFTGASGAPKAPATAKPTSSGRFQNLNAYVKANKNFNKDGGGFAGQVATNVTSKANDLQRNFAQSKDDYNKALEASRQRYDAQLSKNVLDNAGKPAQNLANAPAINPTENTNGGNPNSNVVSGQFTGATDQPGTAVDPAADETAKFMAMRDAQYKGPMELDADYSLRGQAENFSHLTNGVNNETGRFNLLKQLYNKPTYNSGQQTLDNLFLQGDKGQMARLQGAKVDAGRVNKDLASSRTAAEIAALGAAQEAQATRDHTRKDLSGAIEGFDSEQDKAVKDAISGRDQKYLEARGLLGKHELTSEQAQQLGILDLVNSGAKTWDLNPADYLNKNLVDPTKQSIIDQNGFNRINALGKLAGGIDEGKMASILDTYRDPSQVGTYNKDKPYEFDMSRFQNDAAARGSEYNRLATDAQGKVGQAQTALDQDMPWFNQQASTLTSQAQQQYQQQLDLYNQGMAEKPSELPNYAGMTPAEQIRAYYGNTLDPNSVVGQKLTGYDYNNKKLQDSKYALEGLGRKYGANNIFKLLGGSAAQPVEAPTPLATLNGIYNR
jgi:hypothetical protein